MKHILLFLLGLCILVACNRASSKKAFALGKDDFSLFSEKVHPQHEQLVEKYPASVYSFGTCNDTILYKGVPVAEYTTDCIDQRKFLEETFLIFLDSNRVYYYSKGRKSDILSIINKDSLKGTPSIELAAKFADYQRRGYYKLRICPQTNIEPPPRDDERGNNDHNNQTEPEIDFRDYIQIGFCLDIELERPIKAAKAKRAKARIAYDMAEAKANSLNNHKVEPLTKDKIIAKYADKIILSFRMLKEKRGDNFILKLETLKKPNNRLRILGAGESRNIFVDRTFREKVVFFPRKNWNLEVFIKDTIKYNDDSQLSTLSW